MNSQNSEDIPIKKYTLQTTSTLIGKGTFGNVYEYENDIVYKEIKLLIYENNLFDFVLNENNIKEFVFYKSLIASQKLNEYKNKSISYTISKLIPYSLPTSISVPLELKFVDQNIKVAQIYMHNYGEPISKINFDYTSFESIFKQLFETITLLYRCGITHGDIKPNNILVDKDLKLTLIDFGSICFNHSVNVINNYQRCTIFYVSPEELIEDKYSILNDWWSIGIVMFEFITKNNFLKCLLKHKKVDQKRITKFLNYVFDLKYTDDFDPNNFLIHFYANLYQEQINDCIKEYIEDSYYQDLVCKLLTINKDSRKQNIEEIISFFKIELKSHTTSYSKDKTLPFKEININTIKYNHRKDAVKIMYQLCNNELNIGLECFGHSVMLFDRFYVRLMYYNNKIPYEPVSIIMCCISSILLRGELFRATLIQKYIFSIYNKSYSIQDIYDIIYCVFNVLDFQLYNISPDIFLQYKNYKKCLELYIDYPILNNTIEGLIELLK